MRTSRKNMLEANKDDDGGNDGDTLLVMVFNCICIKPPNGERHCGLEDDLIQIFGKR